MRKIRFIPVLFSLGALGLGLLVPAIGQAYSIEKLDVPPQNDFVLEPGKVEVSLNPGESITKTISVTSRANRLVNFDVTTEDFVGTEDENNPVMLLGNDKSPYSFKDNLVPELTRFGLNFGERITFPVTITAPLNAQPGGYYASVLVSNAPDKAGETASTTSTSTAPRTKIISRAGILFFIRINGNAKESGTLTDFRLSPSKWFYEQGPFNFQILFKNDGNVHLVPYGTIEVDNIFGKPTATLPVDAYFSLPQSLRYREISWDKPLLIGRYTATVNLHRSYKNSPDIVDVKTIAFWVIPWKVLIGLFIAAFILLFIFYYVRKNFEFRRKN